MAIKNVLFVKNLNALTIFFVLLSQLLAQPFKIYSLIIHRRQISNPDTIAIYANL